MPRPDCHLIDTPALQLRTGNRAGAEQLLQRASDLWRNQLAVIADDVFSRHCPSTARRRLDRLELTLGTIADDQLETEVPRRFRAALEAELSRLLPAGTAGAVRPEPSLLDTLEHVLRQGYLPWWEPDAGRFDPVRELVHLLRSEPKAVAAMLRRIGGHRAVRVRLVNWLTDKELAAVVRAVAPADAEFILRYADDLQTRQEEEPIVEATTEEFRQAKWEVILAHLLADRGSRFNAKMFLRQTLRDLAAHFRVQYTDLLRELVHVARRVEVRWREASLPLLLDELWTEDVRSVESRRDAMPEKATADLAAESRDGPTMAEDEISRSDVTPSSVAATWRHLDRAGRIRRLLEIEHDGTTDFAAAIAQIDDSRDRAEISDLWRELSGVRVRRDAAAERWRRILRGEAVTEGDDSEQRWKDWHAAAPDIRQQLVAERGEMSQREDIAGVEDGRDPETTELLMAAFRQVLERGSLPNEAWSTREGRSIAAVGVRDAVGWLQLVLVRFADSVPARLRAWVRAGSPLPSTLPEHFADPVLRSIVEAVEPDHADEIERVVETALSGDAVTLTIEPTSERFRRTTWTAVFEYVLSDRGSVFNRRSFLEYTIEHLASRERLSVDVVFSHLLSAAVRGCYDALAQDIRTLAERRGTAATAKTPSTDLASTVGPGGPEAMEKDRATDPGGSSGPRAPRTPGAALRLIELVLTNAEGADAPGITARLGAAWTLLRPDVWQPIARALLLATTPTRAGLQRLLEHGGEAFLESIVFRGEATQRERWQRALKACQSNPLVARWAGDPTIFRARAWKALMAHWRRGGGQAVRDVEAWFTRWLLAELRVPLTATERKGSRPEVGTEDEGQTAAPAEITDEPIAVTNAGLVLLAPFLPELHRRAGLLRESAFVDFRAQQTAVHLLQHLVDGGQPLPEYTLGLNKILCGFDPADSVIGRVELTPVMTDAARGLLENVVRQWPRGAAISPEGLRATYLRRPGRLKRRGKRGWSLQVERKGWDILLTELPWSFGHVHPSWMPGPLIVDWV